MLRVYLLGGALVAAIVGGYVLHDRAQQAVLTAYRNGEMAGEAVVRAAVAQATVDQLRAYEALRHTADQHAAALETQAAQLQKERDDANDAAARAERDQLAAAQAASALAPNQGPSHVVVVRPRVCLDPGVVRRLNAIGAGRNGR